MLFSVLVSIINLNTAQFDAAIAASAVSASGRCQVWDPPDKLHILPTNPRRMNLMRRRRRRCWTGPRSRSGPGLRMQGPSQPSMQASQTHAQRFQRIRRSSRPRMQGRGPFLRTSPAPQRLVQGLLTPWRWSAHRARHCSWSSKQVGLPARGRVKAVLASCACGRRIPARCHFVLESHPKSTTPCRVHCAIASAADMLQEDREALATQLQHYTPEIILQVRRRGCCLGLVQGSCSSRASKSFGCKQLNKAWPQGPQMGPRFP